MLSQAGACKVKVPTLERGNQKTTCFDQLILGTLIMPSPCDRIILNPEIRSGKPIIRGTRITVTDILEYLAGGMSEEEILTDFPDLSLKDIRAALTFAAERERRMFSA